MKQKFPSANREEKPCTQVGRGRISLEHRRPGPIRAAFLQPGYLTAESLKLLLAPHKKKAGEETKYGMGWFIGKSKSGQRIYEHSGASVGGRSELILYPDSRVVVAFACNFSGTDDGWKGEDLQSIGEVFEKK